MHLHHPNQSKSGDREVECMDTNFWKNAVSGAPLRDDFMLDVGYNVNAREKVTFLEGLQNER